MEGFPKITNKVRTPVNIVVHPYMMDHCLEGRAVLPAVEAMEVLAASVKKVKPDVDVSRLTKARFDKFLYLPPGVDHISGFNDISFYENGDVIARLLTKTKSPKAAISRIKEHAEICFSKELVEFPKPPSEALSYPESGVFDIPAEKIYKYLVPFGLAYRNIVDVLHLFEEGAIGTLYAHDGFVNNDAPSLLGSPFPLDAAFHAACAWGRRFARFTAFPVGFESRVILKNTRPGETYFTRVVPIEKQSDMLVFDIWIYDSEGSLIESVSGALMREVSGFGVNPPEWVVADTGKMKSEELKK